MPTLILGCHHPPKKGGLPIGATTPSALYQTNCSEFHEVGCHTIMMLRCSRNLVRAKIIRIDEIRLKNRKNQGEAPLCKQFNINIYLYIQPETLAPMFHDNIGILRFVFPR